MSCVTHGQVCSGHRQPAHAWLHCAVFGFLQDQMVVFFFLQGFENRGRFHVASVRLPGLDVTKDRLKFLPLPAAEGCAPELCGAGGRSRAPSSLVCPSLPPISFKGSWSFPVPKSSNDFVDLSTSVSIQNALSPQGSQCCRRVAVIRTQLRLPSRNPSHRRWIWPRPPCAHAQWEQTSG